LILKTPKQQEGKSTKEVMLRECKMSSSSIASNFCSCCGAFFAFANEHELLHFFDDIFKLKSTI